MATNTAPAAKDAAPPPAVIRPFDTLSDLKVVRYLVGAAVMEPSSIANQAALLQPAMVVVWAGMAHAAVTYISKGWPVSFMRFVKTGSLGDQPWYAALMDWLSCLPLVLVPAIVLLAFFEMRHRFKFEAEMTRAIASEDMVDIRGYYQSNSILAGVENDLPEQRTGFWVLEYDSRIIGTVALDGRKPGVQLASFADQSKDAAAADKSEKPVEEEGLTPASASTTATGGGPAGGLRSRAKINTNVPTPSLSVTPPTPSSANFAHSETVQIRRFAASRSFRPAGIEGDLLGFAASAAFAPASGKSSKTSKSPLPASNIVIAVRPSVQWELVNELKKQGFEPVPKGSELELEMDSEQPSKAFWEKPVEAIWPLDLGWQTYVLKRSVWEKKQQASK